MTSAVRWVFYGRPAVEALAAEIHGVKRDDPLAPVNVIVPSNIVGVTARRLLGSGILDAPSGRSPGGIAAVTFVTVYRMAELLGSGELARQRRRPVSTPVISAALRAALTHDPGLFRPVAAHPATEAALVGAYRELRDCSVGALEDVATRSRRARDVVRLHREARAWLETAYFDEEDLMDAAVATVAGGRVPGGLEGPTIVFLPRRISQHAGRLLAAIAARGELVAIAGTTGRPEADAETAQSLGRIGFECADAPSSATPGPVTLAGARIVTVSDPDEEVRQAVRAVVDAARAGTALERIAIFYPVPGPYGRLVHEQLDAAGIIHNGASAVPLTERLAGRSLLRLLRLPRADYRREEVFAWLSGATLHRDDRPLPVTAWERRSREAGVVAGRDDWDLLLERSARAAEREAGQLERDPETSRWIAEQRRADAASARGLRQFVVQLVDELEAAAAEPRAWSEHVRWALNKLVELVPVRRRTEWPPAEQRAAERVERAIERLAALDALEGTVDLEVFVRTLEVELEADLGRVGRLGEGVLVGPLSYGPGSDLSLLIVLGLAEGSLPATVHDDSLLPDHERAAAGGELALRTQSVERQHHDLLAAMCGAQRQLLLVPDGDLRRGGENVASRWVLELASARAGEPVFSDRLPLHEAPWIDHVASHEAGLRQLAFPATAQEYRLRTLLGQGAQPRLDALGDDVLTAGATVVAARRSTAFTRFDGNLSGVAVPSPLERPTSATRLEEWAKCPHAYLLRHVLGVEEVENPEIRLQISALDRGTLVHTILERFIAEVLCRPPGEQPVPTAPWRAADRDLLFAIAEEECAACEADGLVGRPIFWRRDRAALAADLERFLREDAAHRAAARTRPVAAELVFGLAGARLGPVELRLPDGREVRFRGRADRLDRSEDGGVEVLDYKTGGADGYRGISAENPDDGGQRLQLAVYALAARAAFGDVRVHSAYWFVSARGNFRRIGYEVTSEVLDRVAATTGRVVGAIEDGVFPHRPPATSGASYVACRYCDPDGLGVADLRRQLERKTSDPALAPLLEVAREPLADAAETDSGSGG